MIYQFKISLKATEPLIWRRILVPKSYSFWDLHVAIQDSMGWLDCHLHAFRFDKEQSLSGKDIGIPDDEGFADDNTLAGWEVPIVEYFQEPGQTCDYEYDFGDGWQHQILFERIASAETNQRYPQCLAGAGACPPEDCGGVAGYYRFMEIIANPGCAEYEDAIAWLGQAYEPDSFSPKEINFDNPSERWHLAFSD